MNTPTIAQPLGSGRTWSERIGPSLFDWLFPEARLVDRIAASVALIVLIVVCAKIRFYLPGNPTPLTLQTFAILTAAGIMGFRWGTITIFGYLAIGALGFLAFANQPWWGFTTPVEGWKYVTGLTGGYLIGFIVASAIAGGLSQFGFDRANSIWANSIASIALYVPALIWLAVGDYGWPADGKLMMDGMYIYLPGDFLKLVAASAVVTGLWKFADNRRSGRGSSYPDS